MKLRELESALSEVTVFQNPIAELEQYPTSPHLAAQVVHAMDSSFEDVSGKSICDLGCGTGMLSIAAGLMGAEYVLGVDVDQCAVDTALDNAREFELGGVVDYCITDICSGSFIAETPTRRKFDTVVMNPPFGTKRKGADMAFLHAGVQLATEAVYSMHKTSTRDYILKKAKSWGAQAQVVAELKFDIDRMYKFHKSNSVDVAVDLWRLDVSKIPSSVDCDVHFIAPSDQFHKKTGVHRSYPGSHKRSLRGNSRRRR